MAIDLVVDGNFVITDDKITSRNSFNFTVFEVAATNTVYITILPFFGDVKPAEGVDRYTPPGGIRSIAFHSQGDHLMRGSFPRAFYLRSMVESRGRAETVTT